MALRIQHFFFEALINRKVKQLIIEEKRLKRERHLIMNRNTFSKEGEKLKTIIEENNCSISITNITPTPVKVSTIPSPHMRESLSNILSPPP
jgi:hypothetical protein